MSSKALAQTQDKALQLNLASTIYGTFAEIGAGQETANWFFRASGAAGTVAKTISAYDMTVSDTLYGPVKRYVSEERLKGMLDYEFTQLVNRLGPQRGKDTRFFAFCNTVKVKGYRDNGPWHGWIGVRFQLKPEAKPSDLIIHVRLNDPDHDRQMKDLGILGVNILHAVFFKRDRLEEFIESLVDNLDPRLVEIDVVRFEGHGFSMVDNRLFALQLVQSGLTPATLFLANGQVAQAADVLYKRPIVLMRGSFNPVCNLHLEVMAQVKKTFLSHINETQADRCMEICEISMNNLLRGDDVDHLEFLDRADSLKALGKNVLITKMARFDNLSGLLARYTREPIAIALSIGLLNELFKEKWTEDIPGGILESFGRTFQNKTRLYVSPWLNRKSGEFVTARTFRAPEQYVHLYQHFLANGLVVDVPSDCVGSVIEKIGSRKGEMLEMNPVGSRMKLEFLVPARGLFGYRNEFLTDTKGEGIMASVFDSYAPYKGDLSRRNTGSLIAFETGESITYGLFNAQERGALFIGPGVPVYAGMVVGVSPKQEDITVNVCKKKQLTNMRASGSDEALRLIPCRNLSLEQCLEFLADDELLEVTPKNLRIRKRILDHEKRMKALKGNK